MIKKNNKIRGDICMSIMVIVLIIAVVIVTKKVRKKRTNLLVLNIV